MTQTYNINTRIHSDNQQKKILLLFNKHYLISV